MASDNDGKGVGYGRPPSHSRFKPGRSGNPAGRRKGQVNLKTDLAEELGEKIRVREGARERSISKQRAMIKALVAKALKGDPRAAALLFAMIAKHVEQQAGPAPGVELSASDQAILDDFLRRHAPELGSRGGENG
jgi:hypothetical protein